MFWRYLLIGLTTVLAWAPATLLVVFAFFGLIGGLVNILSVPVSYTLHWVLPSLGGILGYLALTSVSWGIKLTLRKRLTFLIFGVTSLSWVYWRGFYYDGELLSLGNSWFEFFLFGGPILFGVIHIILHLFWLKKTT